tara:strand:- start:326 stop:1321 length:996 start_codon:yes stop_codon:yes gene_type:complete
MKKKDTILITGGAGFIGSHLVERLIAKYKIIVIDNLSSGKIENLKPLLKKIKFYKVDLSNINFMEHLKNVPKIDYIFHLAALADIVPSIQNPINYVKSNILATYNVLELAKSKKVKKIIYSASSSCYGLASVVPTKTSSKKDPQYPYAHTKYIAEQAILHWSKVYDTKYLSFRFFNVYGPRARTNGTYGAVFGTFLAQILNKVPITIVGNGKQKRDFVYISDVVDLLEKSLKSKMVNKIYNVGFGKPRTINDLVKMLNYNNKEYIPKRPGEPLVTHAEIYKTKKDFNWSPKITLEMGVKLMISNINYWKGAPVWTKKKIKEATKVWFEKLG